MGKREGSTIRLFVMDVDGTLTDGTLTYAADGSELKSFHSKDGLAIKLLPRAGVTPAIISGRASLPTTRRARELGIQEVHQDVGDKAACLRDLCQRLGRDLGETAFVGDDLSDLAPMRVCGFSAAPADAAPEVRAVADFVADARGGHGAVREAIEVLLRRDGRWEALVEELSAAAQAGERP